MRAKSSNMSLTMETGGILALKLLTYQKSHILEITNFCNSMAKVQSNIQNSMTMMNGIDMNIHRGESQHTSLNFNSIDLLDYHRTKRVEKRVIRSNEKHIRHYPVGLQRLITTSSYPAPA